MRGAPLEAHAKPPLTGILLAGGEGRRMGFPKAFLTFRGRPVLEAMVEALRPICEEIIVVVSETLWKSIRNEVSSTSGVAAELEEQRKSTDYCKRLFSENGVRIKVDVEADKGPLCGIVTGLSHTETPWAFVVSCDAPLVSPDLVRNMLRYAHNSDVVVPERGGRLQPLQALYRVETVREVAAALLREDRLKVMGLLNDDALRVHTIRETEWTAWGVPYSSFSNLNTPEDLRAVALPSKDSE